MGIHLNAMVHVPKFTLADYAGVTFGGFDVAKYEGSQPNATADDDNPDVADDAAVGSVPVISQPGVAAWRYISQIRARQAVANLGVGHHLITIFESAALALRAKHFGTMPHGNNANTNPPADATWTGETALLDRACNARNAGWYASLTGSGPPTWYDNHEYSGISGLNGNMWEWMQGLYLCPASLNDNSATPHVITGAGEAGYPLILATLNVARNTAPYGSSTSVAAGSLTDTGKAWVVNAFIGYFLRDGAGSLFYIDSNTATAVAIDGANTPVAGPYEILRLVSTNITSGMTSANRILTLRSDADLGPLAIPATSDGTGSATYGNDGYWFSTTSLQAALRGGNWGDGTRAGVFALYLGSAPSSADSGIGLRAARSL